MSKNAIITSLVMVIAWTSCSASAEQSPSSQDIIRDLKQKPRTRGLGLTTLGPHDAALLDAVKHQTTRGLTIEQKSDLADLTAKSALPSIDLEVNFAVDAASLDPTAIGTLRQLGTALQSSDLAGQTFLVAGYTDARGGPEHNMALSDRRAAAVKTYLVKNLGLEPDRLVTVGYGQEHLKNTKVPLADENRRVKISNLGR